MLDIACGSGYGSYFLLKQGAKKVIGIDNDRTTIKRAKGQFHAKNLRFICADAALIPLTDQSVDTIVSLETIEHLAHPDIFIRELIRILKKEGVLIISTPNKNTSYGDNPFHIREYTFQEFTEFLTPFASVSYHGQRRVNKVIISLYKWLFSNIPYRLVRFFLRFRPWENLQITPIANENDTSFLYFLAVGSKHEYEK